MSFVITPLDEFYDIGQLTHVQCHFDPPDAINLFQMYTIDTNPPGFNDGYLRGSDFGRVCFTCYSKHISKVRRCYTPIS